MILLPVKISSMEQVEQNNYNNGNFMNIKNIAILLLSVLISSAYANNYYVAKNGNDSNPGTETQPWLTVQKAANTLVAGDTVFIKAGTYNERVTVQNSGAENNYIVFTNYQDDEVTIDGTGISWERWYGLFDIVDGKNYIEISGLKIKHSYNAGIFVNNSNHVILKNNYTYDTYSSGIGVWSCSYVTAEGNEVELACNDGREECITFSNSHNCEILKNHVHDNGSGENGGEGIDTKEGSHDIKVYQNLVHNLHQRIGIYADAWNKHTYNIDIFQNVVHHCGNNGFNVQSEMGGLIENVNIYNNISYYNKWDGIVVGSVVADTTVKVTPVKNIKIINNTTYKNGFYEGGWAFGILINNPDAENIIVRNNICSENSAQLGVQQIKSGGQIDHNLIYGKNTASGAVTGTDYIADDPKFVDKISYDFHLQSTSPAIDNGSSTDAPDKDYDDNNRPFGNNVDIGCYEYTSNVLLKVKIFLEGAYNSTTKEMTMNINGQLPLTSPYSEDPRNVSSVPPQAVDWILIQLRNTATGSAITSKSVFINKDGKLINDNGTSKDIELTAPEGNYFIVIKHRNHLAVMSTNAISLNSTASTSYDFTTGSEKFYGTGGAKQIY